MLKWIKRLVALVLLLIIGGGVALYFVGNNLLRSGIVELSNRSLRLPTSLDSARLSLLGGGDFSMAGLQIGSPEGFDAPYLFRLDGARAVTSYSDLRGKPIRIQSITLDAPAVTVEQKDGRFNFQALSQVGGGGEASPAPGTSEPVRVIIGSIAVNDARVTIRPGIPGLPAEIGEIVVDIPSFTLTNVGNADGAQNGEELRRIAADVVGELVSRANASDKIPEQLRAILGTNIDTFRQQIEDEVMRSTQRLIDDATRGVTEPIRDVTDRANRAVEGVGRGLEDATRGILGGRRGGDDPDEKPAP